MTSSENSQVMPYGSMVWLAQNILDVHVKAVQTFPDTPNMYGADLRVLGDQGSMDLSPLTGHRGRDGQVLFQTRLVADPKVTTVAQLPTDLTNTPYDIGKFYLLDELDANGHVTNQWAYVWYGTSWRKLMCGVTGDPGPVPGLQLHTTLLEAQEYPSYPDTTSYMSTSGPHLAPSWDFKLAVPEGPTGAATTVASMPDVDLNPAPATNSVLMCTDRFNAAGEAVFEPRTLTNYRPLPYSVPESTFTAYSGVAQQHLIGSFVIPDPGYDFTPIVWGHIGGSGRVITQAGTIANTIQHIAVAAAGGTYTLASQSGDIKTDPIPFNASPAQVQKAIAKAIGAVRTSVAEGLTGLTHGIEFTGTLAGQPIPTITADTSSLFPTGIAQVLIKGIQTGGGSGGVANAIQHIAVSAIGGFYKLIVDSKPTAPIRYNATPTQVQAAINAVVGAGNTIVQNGMRAFNHAVEFVEDLAGQNIGDLVADISKLLPAGTSSVTIKNIQQGSTTAPVITELLSGHPFKIGCQVLLGNATSGAMVARGRGNLLGHVNLMPHYSTPNNHTQNITPVNEYAVVKTGSSAAARTLYFNLWNDGQFGFYNFSPHNAEMFILVNPIDVVNSMFSYHSTASTRRGVARRRKPR